MGRSGWVLITLALVLGFVLRQNLLLLIGIFLALIAAAATLWQRFSLAGLTYQRRFTTTRLHIGDEVEMAVEVVNAKPLPLASLIVVDELPAEFEVLDGRTLFSPNARRRIMVNTFSLRWYERVTRTYRLRPTRRGLYAFGPAQLSTGDIFGFAIRRTTVNTDRQLVVYPRMVPLAALGLPDLYPFGEMKTRRRILDDPLRSVGAREYVPGDSPRFIHWKATARRRSLQTRLFEPSADRPLALFLNTRTGEFADEGIERHVLEMGVTAAASIARWAWERRYPVGLYVNSVLHQSGEAVALRPATRPEQLTDILEALSRMRDDGRYTLATTLQTWAGRLPYGTALVVITAVVNERLLATLMTLRRKEYGVTLITLGRGRLPRPLPGIINYHIDSEEPWHEVASLALA